ncbi:MAG: CHAT domain-containing protein [Bacteroidetes bacterium]|nr:CHAT domain-containing protein [Bacteroidota bacterium]
MKTQDIAPGDIKKPVFMKPAQSSFLFFLFALFLLLLPFPVYSQNELLSHDMPADTLLARGKTAMTEMNFFKALDYFSLAEKLELPDTTEAQLLLNMGRCYFMEAYFDEAKTYLDRVDRARLNETLKNKLDYFSLNNRMNLNTGNRDSLLAFSDNLNKMRFFPEFKVNYQSLKNSISSLSYQYYDELTVLQNNSYFYYGNIQNLSPLKNIFENQVDDRIFWPYSGGNITPFALIETIKATELVLLGKFGQNYRYGLFFSISLLGSLYLEISKYDQAEKYLSQSLELYRTARFNKKYTFAFASTFYNLQFARYFLNQPIELNQETFPFVLNKMSPTDQICYRHLESLYYEQNELPDSLILSYDHFLSTVNTIQPHADPNRLIINSNFHQSTLRDYIRWYGTCLAVNDQSTDLKLLSSLASLDEEDQTRRNLKKNLIRSNPGLQNKMDSINVLYTQIKNTKHLSSDDPLISSWIDQKSGFDLAVLENYYKTVNRGFSFQTYNWSVFQNQIQPGSGVLVWMKSEYGLRGILLTRSQIRSWIIGKTETDSLEKQILTINNLISRKAAVSEIQVLSRSLFKGLLKPVEKELKSLTHLSIIPDGFLWGLSFDILMPAQQYLAESMVISYQTSLQPYKKNEVPGSWPQKGIMVNNPDYIPTIRAARFSEDTTTITLRSSASVNDYFSQSPKSIWLSPLTDSETESDLVNGFFPESVIFTGEEATEANLKSVIESKSRFIHLSTHSFMNFSNPELSGFILGSNEDGSTEDGIFRQIELQKYKLNTQITFLGSCMSAHVFSNDPGSSLIQFFLDGGSQTVIGSVSPIGDYETSVFTGEFYKQLKAGINPGWLNWIKGIFRVEIKDQTSGYVAEVLHQTKVSLIRSGEFSHPLFWTPFVIYQK